MKVETKIQLSRQLNFSDQVCPRPLDQNEDEDLRLTACSSDEDNELGIKPLEISHNKLDTSTFSAERELSSDCREIKNKIPSCIKSSLDRENSPVLSGHDEEKGKSPNNKEMMKLDSTDSSKNVETNGPSDLIENNKTLGETFVLDSSKYLNHKDCHKSHCLPVANDEPTKNVEREDFEMSSDDELFRDPLIFENLCEGTQAFQDQENCDSQGSVNLGDKQRQQFSQSLDSVTQECTVKIEHYTDVDERQCPLPLKQTVGIKEETQSKKPGTGLKQTSLLSFAAKENKKATTSRASLKQTDIGVFFGLKPLKPQVDNKRATQNEPKVTNSSQASSVSQRRGGWGARKKYNQDVKNTGYTSEGQSSGQGEEVAAGATGVWSRKSCPFYKKIPNCGITVDAFRYGNIPGCRAYFLSHFHYDHYAGLNGKFMNPIYCSKVNRTSYMMV